MPETKLTTPKQASQLASDYERLYIANVQLKAACLIFKKENEKLKSQLKK